MATSDFRVRSGEPFIPSEVNMDEIRRAELKRLVAEARGGGLAPGIPRLPGQPNASAADGPFASRSQMLLLDSDYSVVSRGIHLSLAKWRERLRDGPVSFAWMVNEGSKGHPGSGHLSFGQALLTSKGEFRAAISECAFDRSPLRFDPTLDRWSCGNCGSAFNGLDGKVVSAPAVRPIVTFTEKELDEGRRLALLPPKVRSRNGAVG